MSESELKILRALCGKSQDLPAREALIANLENYEWAEEEHRVVFQAILGLGAADAATLREHLPAVATRMGFPDISWEDYFGADPGENIQIQEQLRILRDA